MLRNGIPRVCFYFFSTERNSEHFSPLRSGSELNFESFLFRGMVQNEIPRVLFYLCSMVQNSEHSSPLRNGSERNSESFMFRGTAGIPPEQTNCSVYSVFRGILFFVGNCQPLQVLYRKRRQKDFRSFSCTFIGLSSVYIPSEAEFMDVIGTKVFRVFLLATHSHLY